MINNKVEEPKHNPLETLSPKISEEHLNKFMVELAKWGIPASLLAAFLAKIF